MIVRILRARDEIIYILGIDMSRAFDTIDRNRLIDELRAIIDEDSWRMVAQLLANTTLEVKLRTALSNPFKTNIGAPQGDSLSPVLFIVYLELAMRQIRAACPRPAADSIIPTEVMYADDTDFVSTSSEIITAIENSAETILKSWNLAMNRDKTEKTKLKREEKRTEEHWRAHKETWHTARRHRRNAKAKTARSSSIPKYTENMEPQKAQQNQHIKTAEVLQRIHHTDTDIQRLHLGAH